MRRSSCTTSQALLTVRSALVLGVSCISGALAAALILVSSGSLTKALLTAGAVTAGCVGLLNQIIIDDTELSEGTVQKSDGNGH
jgi:hypothetical protein